MTFEPNVRIVGSMEGNKYTHHDTIRVIATGKEYHILAYDEVVPGRFLAVNCHAGTDDFIELSEDEVQLASEFVFDGIGTMSRVWVRGITGTALFAGIVGTALIVYFTES